MLGLYITKSINITAVSLSKNCSYLRSLIFSKNASEVISRLNSTIYPPSV